MKKKLCTGKSVENKGIAAYFKKLYTAHVDNNTKKRTIKSRANSIISTFLQTIQSSKLIRGITKIRGVSLVIPQVVSREIPRIFKIFEKNARDMRTHTRTHAQENPVALDTGISPTPETIQTILNKFGIDVVRPLSRCWRLNGGNCFAERICRVYKF